MGFDIMKCPECNRELPDDARFCLGCGSEVIPDRTIPTSDLVKEPKIGEVIDNRYRVEERLGKGGMGIVCRARDLKWDMDVVLKVPPPELLLEEDAVSIIRDESAITARLNHPNIIRVFDFYESGLLCFIKMEYVEGKTLARLRSEKGALVPDEVIKYGIELCEALGYAHNKGVIHRDIKPSNVMVDKSGRVKLMEEASVT